MNPGATTLPRCVDRSARVRGLRAGFEDPDSPGLDGDRAGPSGRARPVDDRGAGDEDLGALTRVRPAWS